MSFGYQREVRVFLNDTATLDAYLYDEAEQNLIPATQIIQALFTVLSPSDNPATPTISGQPGTLIGDGAARFLVPGAVNTAAGQYHAFSTFTYTDSDGTKTRSTPCNYDCIDLFEQLGSSPADPSIDLCWKKLEDLFDSELGGPWLRDQTLGRFDKSKIAVLLPDVFFEVNAQQPQTNYTIDDFGYTGNDGLALIAQGLMVHTIKHLMRSYAEQPDVVGAQVNYFDRKRYLDTWTSLYTVELDRWKKWLWDYKLRTYGHDNARLLVASKAGRLVPAPMRTRFVGRGYY